MSEPTLFLNTSSNVQFGLLDNSFKWIDFLEIQNKKGSSILHGELFNFLKKNKFKIKEIKKLVIGSGPGSYTGIRLSEGFSQIFNDEEREVYSFYDFEIPKMANIKKGHWCAEAFKKKFLFMNGMMNFVKQN